MRVNDDAEGRKEKTIGGCGEFLPGSLNSFWGRKQRHLLRADYVYGRAWIRKRLVLIWKFGARAWTIEMMGKIVYEVMNLMISPCSSAALSSSATSPKAGMNYGNGKPRILFVPHSPKSVIKLCSFHLLNSPHTLLSTSTLHTTGSFWITVIFHWDTSLKNWSHCLRS